MTPDERAILDSMTDEEYERACDEREVINYGGQDCFAAWDGPTSQGRLKLTWRAWWAGDGYEVAREPEFVEVIE